MIEKTILLVDDEKNILELLNYNLGREGFRMVACTNGDDAAEMAIREKVNLIVLDLMLPGMSGLDVCKMIRQNYKTRHIPIVMVTAKAEDTDIILGLELGADDYMTKPFSIRQLVARVKAVLRRFEDRSRDEIFHAGALELDVAKHIAAVSGKPIQLTSKEFAILRLFMEAPERVHTRESILEHVWGHDESLHMEPRVVDKHVAEIRRKIKQEAQRILTIKNTGYRFLNQ